MRLEKASYKAIKFACLKFHYAKAIPVTPLAFSVFNNNNEWCGVITFGFGANAQMGTPYNCKNGEFLELTRMALNGKQESTSKAMSIAIKLIKKYAPLVRLIISYADKGQNHIGTIYQATNWYFVDESESSGIEVFHNGRWVHSRIKGTYNLKQKQNILERKKPGKYKYLYPLNKDMKIMCEKLKKEYPKRLSEKVESNANS